MPNGVPRRKAIIQKFRDRLAEISVANGFRTDAGARLFVNTTPVFGPHDPAVALALMIGLDDPGFQGEHVATVMPLIVQAIVQETNLDEPWDVVEDVIADIKQAIELEDRRLGKLVKGELRRGPTQTLERESGSDFTGAEIRYFAPFHEVWGQPNE